MQLDLRYPIGGLLAIYGGILVVQGAIVGDQVLGFNVNLIWGATMFLCGVAILALAKWRA